MLYPPQKGRVSHAAAPFSQPSHPVSKTQLKAQIPTNTQDHDFLVEVPTFEQFLDWYESRHLPIIPELLVRLHQSPLDTAGLQRVPKEPLRDIFTALPELTPTMARRL